MTPEGKLKKEIKVYLKNLGPKCWYFMPVPSGYGIRGIPDFVGVYKGQFFSIEAKAPGGKVAPWQDRVMDLINNAGGLTIVAWELKDVEGVLL